MKWGTSDKSHSLPDAPYHVVCMLLAMLLEELGVTVNLFENCLGNAC